MQLRVLGVSLVVAACLVSASPAATIDLHITVWPKGKAAGHTVTWVLGCGPAVGTLPRPGRACRLLQALRSPFAPVPPDEICTEIYGGPQIALVSGTFLGQRVWTYFKRTDGCQVARWNRVAFLFPAGG
jgi:Subtilisin inhibitor-like